MYDIYKVIFISWKERVKNFIIFGTRGVTSSKAKGKFFCPSCQSESDYNHKQVKRFGTLYFIPLLPMDDLGDYVECQKCKNTYNQQVLDYNPEKDTEIFQAEYENAIKKLMILMLLADGEIDENEINSVITIYEKITNTVLSREELIREIDNLKDKNHDVIDFTGSLRGQLNDHGKETIIKVAYLIAYADGEFHESEQDLLLKIAESLDFSKAHLTAVLKEMAE